MFLCKLRLYIHNPRKLWKTPVEKPVYTVENSELSTGIFPFFPVDRGCGEACIHLCINPSPAGKAVDYVTIGFWFF